MRTNERILNHFMLAVLVFLAMPLTFVKAQAVQSSMEQMAKESDAVVVGKVSGLASEWNDTRTRIQTRVVISVDQSIKGDASAKALTVIVPGGEVDGVGEVYSHSPRFQRDESVVVFAKKNTSGSFLVSNGNQGKYTIVKDEVSSKLSVAGGRTIEEFTASIKTALQIQDMK